jgi:hypothetical protein
MINNNILFHSEIMVNTSAFIIISIFLSSCLVYNIEHIYSIEDNFDPFEGFSCSESQIETNPSNDSTVFKSNEYGFEITFPSKWEGNIASCIPNIENMSFIPTSVAITLNSTNTKEERGYVGISITLDTRAGLEDLKSTHEMYTFFNGTSSHESILFSGIPAFKTTSNLGFGKIVAIGFVHNNNMFDITYPLFEDSKYDKKIQNILDSFQLLVNDTSKKAVDPSIEFG